MSRNDIYLLIILAALTGIALCVRYLLRRRAMPGKHSTPGELPPGIPQGQSALFQFAIYPGGDGIPLIYTLASCRHCVFLKKFLLAHDINFHNVQVDNFSGQARAAITTTLRGYNPKGSFPTLVLPGGKTIVGFRENEAKEAFGLNEEKEN
jgi:glutaredoxin